MSIVANTTLAVPPGPVSTSVNSDGMTYLSYYQFFTLMQQMQLTDVLNSTSTSELLSQIQGIMNNVSKSEYEELKEETEAMANDTKTSTTLKTLTLLALSLSMLLTGGLAMVGAVVFAGLLISSSIYEIIVADKKIAAANIQYGTGSNSTLIDLAGSLNDDLASSRTDSMKKLQSSLGQANAGMSYQQQAMIDIGAAGRRAKK